MKKTPKFNYLNINISSLFLEGFKNQIIMGNRLNNLSKDKDSIYRDYIDKCQLIYQKKRSTCCSSI